MLTPKQKSKTATLYHRGVTFHGIAEQLAVPLWEINPLIRQLIKAGALKARGSGNRGHGQTERQRLALQMRADGFTFNEIAEQFGLNSRQAAKFLCKYKPKADRVKTR